MVNITEKYLQLVPLTVLHNKLSLRLTKSLYTEDSDQS